MTGRCHEAGRPHTLSADGWPLLVRYDLARLARRFSRDDFAAAGGLWHWAPLLPVARERDRPPGLPQAAPASLRSRQPREE